MSSLSSHEGESPFSYPSAPKPLKTWYKTFGDLTISKSQPSIKPLIIVHGGPGMTHHYLTPHTHLTEKYSIPIILYDQIGCGESTHLPELAGDTSFWTIDLFIAELESLISHLGLQEYDILGSSWGGMLASKFAASNPAGLRRLILSNSPASAKIRYESTAEYRRELPEEIQAIIDKHEAAGTFDDPEYDEAYQVFIKRHICNLDSIPEPLLKSMIESAKDRTVANVMSGSADKFQNLGTLAGYSMIGEAKKIRNRTLLINGNREIASDAAVRPFWREIERCKWVTMMGSTHAPHFEEEEKYMGIVSEFLIEE
ncbi:proline-specific peptidase [Stipitochalara longipes BDJ]|nr:proline-specific peptidase [Stipitochalara longipes BDJ]